MKIVRLNTTPDGLWSGQTNLSESCALLVRRVTFVHPHTIVDYIRRKQLNNLTLWFLVYSL